MMSYRCWIISGSTAAMQYIQYSSKNVQNYKEYDSILALNIHLYA